MRNLQRLPKGFALDNGSVVRSLLYEGEEWYILDTSGDYTLLMVAPSLSQRWTASKILEEKLLGTMSYEGYTFSVLKSKKSFILSPVEGGRSPESKVDGMAFSLALKESRRLDGESSFHDAIYVEQYSRLLPTWTLTPKVDDEIVLGTWLSGGVVISALSFRRLTALVGWLPPADLAEIVETAGFEVSANVPLSKQRKRETTPAGVVKKQNDHPAAVTSKEILSRGFTLPGRQALEAFFNEHVIDIVFNSERYSKLGIGFPSAIVLHGPPGCGKTFAVERLVEFLDWPCFSIDSGSVGSSYIHETSRKISEAFDKAIEAAPSVLVIDEMESFLSERGGAGTSALFHVEEVAEFLRRIPEAGGKRVLVVAMTNMIDMIDPAILRRGRFDHVVEVEMPSRDEIKTLLLSLLAKLPVEPDVSLESALSSLCGAPLSDIAFLVRESARLAAKAGKARIDQQSFDDALDRVHRAEKKTRPQIGF